ncbi:MAG: porin [Chitinophagales bacterium]
MNLYKIIPCVFCLFLVFNSNLTGQPNQEAAEGKVKSEKEKKPFFKKEWFQRINIRGYAQARYNRLLETNDQLKCDQCDKSWGEDGGFFMRRIRVIFFGQISTRVYFYIQPDFASTDNPNVLNFVQLRDAYFDIGIDKHNQFRFRIGQSKVPFGFENMQSSQNRLPLDRNDGLNSALANERDIGIFFYWAPKKIRELYSTLNPAGLKGSGDYGVFGLGVFNGQTANRPELNKNKHIVARLSYPFEVRKQIIEPGIQAYTGEYELREDQLSEGVKVKDDRNYTDQRVAATFVLYPKPFGIQAEYNIGRGPEFNPATDSIELKSLTGGYITLNYKIGIKKQLLYPFMRLQYYEGGKKHERDARKHKVNELEIGVEWLPIKNFELVVMYTISSRRFEDYQNPDNFQKGRLLRLQAQVNF